MEWLEVVSDESLYSNPALLSIDNSFERITDREQLMWSWIARNRNEKPGFSEILIIFRRSAHSGFGTDFDGFFMFFIGKSCFLDRKIFFTSKNNIYEIVKCLEIAQKSSVAFQIPKIHQNLKSRVCQITIINNTETYCRYLRYNTHVM